MERRQFEQLVTEALHDLPQEFQERLDNIDVVVEDEPTIEQLAENGPESTDSLLGLYEGVPLTERSAHYGLVLPDKISIFKRAIEKACQSDMEIKTEIQSVVRHEIAHYFGFDDRYLNELGK
jgi:predicted Zn-dependent protease with MMP-like domain